RRAAPAASTSAPTAASSRASRTASPWARARRLSSATSARKLAPAASEPSSRLRSAAAKCAAGDSALRACRRGPRLARRAGRAERVLAIRYRGTVGAGARLEDIEDRIVDLALELGGRARVVRQRGAAGERLVRGLDVALWPGLEVVSLAVAPEGFLIPLSRVEAAAERAVERGDWLATRTDHAAPEGHAALLELLRWLARQPGVALEVEETGRVPEGARVAGTVALVRRVLDRPSEHAPAKITPHPVDDTRDGTDAEWDAVVRENERKLERIARRLEESGALGAGDPAAALEAAFEAEGVGALPV